MCEQTDYLQQKLSSVCSDQRCGQPAKPACRPEASGGQRPSPARLRLAFSLLVFSSTPRICPSVAEECRPFLVPSVGLLFWGPHRAASPQSQAPVRSCPASRSTYLTTQKGLEGVWEPPTSSGGQVMCTCWNVPSFLMGLSLPSFRATACVPLDARTLHGSIGGEVLLKSYPCPSS